MSTTWVLGENSPSAKRRCLLFKTFIGASQGLFRYTLGMSIRRDSIADSIVDPAEECVHQPRLPALGMLHPPQ